MFGHNKLVVYVGRSKSGRWPAEVFIKFARQAAAQAQVTSALLDDGMGVFHMVQGPATAVDHFMAAVTLSRRLRHVRIVCEERQLVRDFPSEPLVHVSDPSWRQRITSLLNGEHVEREDLWHYCKGVLHRIDNRSESPSDLDADDGEWLASSY
ncbi:hypothetical protein PGB34_00875 [Xenophilus arseniciresistens]|uniref:BLUF domain-containing protein n=1 Tax=Xenophilus arseniciresistens TaxID=1283306 RepID=A0AAE3SXG3_9BURK|nr:hypothetical protein [Xenophilus arseniciresistens]MDA7414904.1 hypothetical protein [Xenophilus arseniciresistens]